MARTELGFARSPLLHRLRLRGMGIGWWSWSWTRRARWRISGRPPCSRGGSAVAEASERARMRKSNPSFPSRFTEKELIMKEYHSLKDTNKQLKEQIAETIRCKLEVAAEITSKDMEASTSFSTKFPLVVHNIPPLAPYILPSWPSISPNARSCYEEGNSSKVNGTSTPFCVPPCAWLYPLIHQASGYCPLYSHISKDRDEGTLHRQQDLSRCYEAVDDIYKTSICCGRKIDAPLSTTVATEKEEKVIRSNWKPSKFDAENQKLSSYPDGMVTMPLSFQTSNPSSIAKGEYITDVRDESKDKFDPDLQDKPLGACMYIHEKLVNANAAAKVRKRRKELMKLKHHLHGRDGGASQNKISTEVHYL